jgi:hypothetical protein
MIGHGGYCHVFGANGTGNKRLDSLQKRSGSNQRRKSGLEFDPAAIRALGNKDNGISRVSDNAAVRLPTPLQGAQPAPDWHDPISQASIIQTTCKFLRARDGVFGNLIYSDPSWEIILLLHAARTEGVKVGFSELGRALSASTEILTRCLTLLETNELVLRDGGDADTPLTLSRGALAMIERSFAELPPREAHVWAERADRI